MTTSEPATVIRGPEPLLWVEHIDYSLQFYCDKLGFKLTESWRPNGRLMWCRIERGGSFLMLQQAGDQDGPAAGRGRGVELFFLCDDANAICTEFLAVGLDVAPPRETFYGMNQLRLKDPDGYSLCFHNVVP
jgi:uncharacterized glyoxalase superfamily protein PhnB